MLEIIRFLKNGMDIAYAIADKHCFIALLPTGIRPVALKREVAEAVLQHAREAVRGCELRVILLRDFDTGGHSVWQLDTEIKAGTVRFTGAIQSSSCPEHIVTALRSQAAAPSPAR